MSGPYFADDSVTLHCGDALDVATTLSGGSVDCIVTSPPYFGLRDYGHEGQYGLESSPAEYVATMRGLFSELRRVLADDGTLWLNIGDSYSGKADRSAGASAGRSRPDVLPARVNTSAALGAKQLLGIPWRVAFALQDDGWILRSDVVWSKTNAMPESVRDRVSGRHEHVFMLTKSPRYWFDLDAIRRPHSGESVARASRGRNAPYSPPGQTPGKRAETAPNPLGANPGDVWDIPTSPFPGAHFAVMPAALAERCIRAGCKPGGTVLDPFSGSGTTGLAAAKLGRKYLGIDLNSEYLDLSLRTRLQEPGLGLVM